MLSPVRHIHIRAARTRAKLTQEQLAEKSGIDQRVISSLETRVSNPSWLTALAVAEALDVDPRALRFGPADRAVA